MRILWYKNIFVGEKAQKKKRTIMWKLQHGAGMLRVFVLMMPSNPDNSLDIINAAYLKQPVYKNRELKIVGIAVTYEEALQVLEKIVQEVYSQTGSVNIRTYLDTEHNFRKRRV